MHHPNRQGSRCHNGGCGSPALLLMHLSQPPAHRGVSAGTPEHPVQPLGHFRAPARLHCKQNWQEGSGAARGPPALPQEGPERPSRHDRTLAGIPQPQPPPTKADGPERSLPHRRLSSLCCRPRAGRVRPLPRQTVPRCPREALPNTVSTASAREGPPFPCWPLSHPSQGGNHAGGSRKPGRQACNGGGGKTGKQNRACPAWIAKGPQFTRAPATGCAELLLAGPQLPPLSSRAKPSGVRHWPDSYFRPGRTREPSGSVTGRKQQPGGGGGETQGAGQGWLRLPGKITSRHPDIPRGILAVQPGLCPPEDSLSSPAPPAPPCTWRSLCGEVPGLQQGPSLQASPAQPPGPQPRQAHVLLLEAQDC